jgi:hypothetical protein
MARSVALGEQRVVDDHARQDQQEQRAARLGSGGLEKIGEREGQEQRA